MKTVFAEYYTPSPTEFGPLLKTAIVAVDTSVLLGCYRLSQKTADELLALLAEMKDRLWMPHQVGLEYHENCESVILELRFRHLQFEQELSKGLNATRAAFGNYRHPFIRERVLSEVDDFEQRLKKTYDSVWNIDELDQRAVEVKEKLEKLYDDDKVGQPFTPAELDAIATEGAIRYQQLIPPGFRDKDKDKKPSWRKRQYGDLIIWKQLLARAKERGVPVIFITDDVSDDWWLIIRGEKKGPLPALRLEMFREAAQSFYAYTVEQFLKYATPVIFERAADEVALQDASANTGTRVEMVRCPHCDRETECELGGNPGSTTRQLCVACERPFNIHRRGDGTAFSKPFNGSMNDDESLPFLHNPRENVVADCPHLCGDKVRFSLGVPVGSSAKPWCVNGHWFHAHRVAEGVATRLPGRRGSLAHSSGEFGLTSAALEDSQPSAIIYSNQ